jgi:PAS domain S-box-containing protein
MTDADNAHAPDLDSLVAQRLAAIVESSDDAIISKALDGRIVSWNKAAERIFGYSAEEMMGKTVYQLIPLELHAEEAEILQRIARGEHVGHYETTRLRKDGQKITISLTVSPLYDSSGKIHGAASIKRDITSAKRAEMALRQAAKMEAIGRLAGGLAHDFNNQLHALSGFAHFISRDKTLSQTSRQDLLQIQKVTERMASLTHQLLAFARQQVLSLEMIDLSVVVQDAHPMMQRLIGTNYDIRMELAPGPRWVLADRSQLVQVLMNLVINARDAMPEGGRVLIQVDTLEAGPGQVYDRLRNPVEAGAYALLRVRDAGQGIPPSEAGRIFEPFYTTKEAGKGTGLGLATVEGIVSQSGGHIQMESEPGQGTTFTILFPLSYSEGSHPGGGTDDSDARWLGRVLVVDDDEQVRAVIGRLLQSEGYEVITAASGAEALHCMEQGGGAVDLVVTDLVMPSMSGQELTRRLAKNYPGVAVVWMSGHPLDESLPGDMIGQPFMQKPITPDELVRVVGEQMRQSSASRGR